MSEHAATDGLDQYRNSVNHALKRFQDVRDGTISVFRDTTGIDDDGSGEYIPEVTVDTVDAHEAQFRQTWAWLCPELIASPDIAANQE